MKKVPSKEYSILNEKEFYHAIGMLFYAISKIDRRIVIDEKRKIVEVVDKYWARTIGRTNSREIVYSKLRDLIKEKASAQETYSEFKHFYNENKDHITYQIKENIMNSISCIIHAYAGQNKSELTLAFNLHHLFFRDDNSIK